nr:hypothetical protein KitaXyl93_68020 [Kitasatospora sp. Xyl93]
MWEDTADYSTVAGPRWAVEALLEFWHELETPRRFEVSHPRFVDLSRISERTTQRFNDSHSPAIAVARHRPGVGVQATARLQAEMMISPWWRYPMPPYPAETGLPLLWEPGFQFRAAHGGGGIPDPFDPAKLLALRESAPTIADHRKAAGRTVAVLDTGIRGVGGTMLDFLDCDVHGPQLVAADDPHGHGTAVAKIIETIRGNAVINPVRVLDHRAEAKSYEVLAALMYTLFCGEYDLVNASLTTPVFGSSETALGRTIDFTLLACHANGVSPVPVLVAAAGNTRGKASGYPARVSEAVVVLAKDEQGRPARYNSTPPEQAITEWAYGGSTTDSLGDLNSLTGLTGAGAQLWGTSFAAAVVSGAYLP